MKGKQKKKKSKELKTPKGDKQKSKELETPKRDRQTPKRNRQTPKGDRDAPNQISHMSTMTGSQDMIMHSSAGMNMMRPIDVRGMILLFSV